MATITMTERRSLANPGATRARWCTVQIETEAGVFVGNMYVPDTKKRLSDVLCDDRPFISLVQVSMNGSGRLEPYLAVNKRYVRTVRILQEGAAEGASVRH